jgi:E3 ubiquitin-protein ligase MYCBP2
VPAFGPEAHRLVCGSCSVTSRGKECKKGHGAEEMEYKCRYCCDVAVWFCFGTTHFCDACHTKWVTASPDWETDPPMKACTRKTCPLRVEHPEHGQEFCLGCAVCRSLKASQQE